jgi:hypothetical protein
MEKNPGRESSRGVRRAESRDKVVLRMVIRPAAAHATLCARRRHDIDTSSTRRESDGVAAILAAP